MGCGVVRERVGRAPAFVTTVDVRTSNDMDGRPRGHSRRVPTWWPPTTLTTSSEHHPRKLDAVQHHRFLIASMGQRLGRWRRPLKPNHVGVADLVVAMTRLLPVVRQSRRFPLVGDWTDQRLEQNQPTGNNTERAFPSATSVHDDGIDAVTTTEEHGYATLEISVNRNGYFDELYSAEPADRWIRTGGDVPWTTMATDCITRCRRPSLLGGADDIVAPALPGISRSIGSHYDFDGDGYDELISAEHGKDHVASTPMRRGPSRPTIISSLDATRVDIGPTSTARHHCRRPRGWRTTMSAICPARRHLW